MPPPTSLPTPYPELFRLAAAVLSNKTLDFHAASARACSALPVQSKILGSENIPAAGPCLLTTNHYTRSGLPSWWMVMLISSAIPAPVHWVISESWTADGRWYGPALTSLTRRLFQRVARVYGFTTMPPMPPRPFEVSQRAFAVRNILTLARNHSHLILGMSPEGRDEQNCVLQAPPVGVGRFLYRIHQYGFPLLPVGVFDDGPVPCVRFGPRYNLYPPPGFSSANLNEWVSKKVMSSIAGLLPTALRGEFDPCAG